ncbi:aminotransferase class I/II-fold pyridoxal phosphate-dependent enzyme [Pontiellaceae bacterium B12227]|nr:aminotransferase class I/II-fold pyridoxal phosphate-dependent enzyme [Pontiellaceae bacterium B12227]
MPQEELRKNPLWRAEDLGKPIPNTKHAASMCLPRWQDVVGYETKDPATMEKLTLGYPRFFYHPLVQQAFEKFKTDADEAVQIYATAKAARRCREYLLHHNPYARIELRDNLISFPDDCADDAKEYWQHAGEGISSRCAEALLNEEPAPDASKAWNKIIDRVAAFTGAVPEDVYLFSSGMSAINAAFLATLEIHPGCPTVQYAFPYGDTLKLQNKMGHKRALFYARGDAADFQSLETKLTSTQAGGLFCEFPTNPLLACVDLPKLRALADQHHFPLIIDETLGACINQNTLPVSDVTAVSLTKFFSGTSDVLGGALILNSKAPFAAAFREQLQSIYEPDAFHAADVIQLEKDSRDFRERVEQINTSSLAVCEYLKNHTAVETVYYPAFTDREMYDRFRRPEGGYGGLFSFVLKEAEKHTEAVYDALEITKGPNLGTSFSLCCPFTLLAHYDELEWAESAGASRWLIRISVGTEQVDELIARLERALPNP